MLKKSNNNSVPNDKLTHFIVYRPPYHHENMLNFLKVRAIPGIEWVSDLLTYRRSYTANVNGTHYSGWIEVRFQPDKHQVQCTMKPSLLPIVDYVLSQIRRVFDLDFSPENLPSGIPKGIRLPGSFNGFEMGTRAILGQQITVKAAHTIAGRLVMALGTDVITPWPEINKLFPSAETIYHLGTNITETLGQLGVIKSRAYAIQALAEKFVNQEITFKPEEDFYRTRNILLSIKGIGQWTADYLTMRGMSCPDVFLEGDVGVRHALMHTLKDENGNLIYDPILVQKKLQSKLKMQKSFEKHALAHAEKYRPWRSYYTLSLWYSL